MKKFCSSEFFPSKEQGRCSVWKPTMLELFFLVYEVTRACVCLSDNNNNNNEDGYVSL